MKTFPVLLSCGALTVLFSSCSSPRATVSAPGQMQTGGDAITGVVVSSSPDHMLIRIDDLPEWALNERAAADTQIARR